MRTLAHILILAAVCAAAYAVMAYWFITAAAGLGQ